MVSMPACRVATNRLICRILYAAEKLERDFFMTAEEAMAFGVVDDVIQERTSLQPERK